MAGLSNSDFKGNIDVASISNVNNKIKFARLIYRERSARPRACGSTRICHPLHRRKRLASQYNAANGRGRPAGAHSQNNYRHNRINSVIRPLQAGGQRACAVRSADEAGLFSSI
ncbi:hypothetical protein EVAR_16004_1 [Eumeta japonica]|uniref:Uncharacterized protein n=1 Tax=Eumeta variegata TaxID=151549 RepID=A0A4C1ZP26_EUMVA|nr:hypothetical protein EVAR_16004_1 [Eumeta japonica]